MRLTTTTSEKETISLAESYGKKLKGGEVFLLCGDLGGGKTQFAKGLASGLAVKEPITSPTFNYENIYPARDGLTLYHFDLYRNDRLDDDIRDLLLEAFADPAGVTVVEWAERAKEIWPVGATLVDFKWIAESERNITIKDL